MNGSGGGVVGSDVVDSRGDDGDGSIDGVNKPGWL